jgi:hypothetical protein
LTLLPTAAGLNGAKRLNTLMIEPKTCQFLKPL